MRRRLAPKPLDQMTRAEIIHIVSNHQYWFAPMITAPAPAIDDPECEQP